MNTKQKLLGSILIVLLTALCTYTDAQTEQEKLTATILHLDSAFWNAYNNCDTMAYKNFFTDDIEFYHDKGGFTAGAQALIESLSKNLCRNPDYHLRREAVAGTIKVFPMQKNNEMYGAVITGEHLFYITQNNKPEFLDGDANFTNLWLLKDGVWKMSRVLSYNHHAATYVNARKEIALSDEQLDRLTGKYASAQSGVMTLKKGNHLLILSDDKNNYRLYPQSDTSFFTKDRDLVFEFVSDASGKPSKIIVKEHGAVADELLYQK